MKKIKYLLFAVLCSVLFVGTTYAKDKVKVYVFEAGGCPYCEAQIEYLEGLDSYNKKFEIVKKELYVDHVEWKEGKDYDLGVKVANAFKEKGYSEASYEGTPFVVISNIYAAASYSESLESVINKAYEAGDKDIVGCYIGGKEDCADDIEQNTETTETTENNKTTDPEVIATNDTKSSPVVAIVAIVAIVALITILVIVRKKNK